MKPCPNPSRRGRATVMGGPVVRGRRGRPRHAKIRQSGVPGWPGRRQLLMAQTKTLPSPVARTLKPCRPPQTRENPTIWRTGLARKATIADGSDKDSTLPRGQDLESLRSDLAKLTD